MGLDVWEPIERLSLRLSALTTGGFLAQTGKG